MKAFDDKFVKAAAHNGFKWNNQIPKTAKHVQDILSLVEILEMLKDGKSHLEMSYLISWIFCSNFQHGMDYWVKSAIIDYFKKNDTHVILGDLSENGTRQHYMIRIAKKIVTNNFLTTLHASCLKL